MNRYYFMLLVVSVCLIVAGCRRTGGVTRKPAEAQVESDLLKARNDKELIHALKPADRKVPIWLVPVKELENDRKRAAQTATVQEELEKAQDGGKTATQKRDQAAQVQEEEEFRLFADAAFKFLNKSPHKPTDFSQENFYKFVRRENYIYKRKLIDRTDNDVVAEEIRLTKYLDQSSMTFVPDVDMEPEAGGDYVIAHRGAGGGGGGLRGGFGGGGGGGQILVMFSKGGDIDKNKSSLWLTDTLHSQDLRLLRTHFLGFAANHYVKPAADPRERDVLANVLVIPSYEALLKHLQYRDTQAILNSLEQNVPGLLKRPPETCEFDKLKKYLKENAPPGVLTNLNRVTALNISADLRNPNAILACRIQQDFVEVNKQKVSLGHRAVFTNGRIAYVPHAFVQAILAAAPPPEKKKDNPGRLPRD
jgi:hypothetical protein